MTILAKYYQKLSLQEYKTFHLIIFFIITGVISYLLLSSSITDDLTEINEQEVILNEPIAIVSPHTPDILWHNYHIKPGNNLTYIFKQLDLSTNELYKILQLGDIVKPLTKLRANTSLEYAVNQAGNLVQMIYPISPQKKLSITSIDGKFNAKIINTQIEKRVHHTNFTIDNSLLGSGIRAGIPRKIIIDVMTIFKDQIDFNKELRSGDSVTIIYEDFYCGDNKINNGTVLAARLYNRNTLYEAMQYKTASGQIRYFTPNGESLQQAFIRRPLQYKRISSQFNNGRKHPILGIIRKHNGVDYAAPVGTPIKAASDGIISYVGRKGGYGRTLIIKHGKKYTTLYAHLSKYASRIKKGQKVRKGEVIGYVGNSGLATAPHLHYEFWVNGQRVDPEKVKLPFAEPLTGKDKQKFLMLAQALHTQLAMYDNKHNNKNIG